MRNTGVSLEHGVSKSYGLAIEFTERVRRSYAEHRFAGRSPFESIAEQGGPILMDRSLTP